MRTVNCRHNAAAKQGPGLERTKGRGHLDIYIYMATGYPKIALTMLHKDRLKDDLVLRKDKD
jgi:hypothetical protein